MQQPLNAKDDSVRTPQTDGTADMSVQASDGSVDARGQEEETLTPLLPRPCQRTRPDNQLFPHPVSDE